MKARLVQSPEGAPNSCFAVVQDEVDGEDLLFIQSDWDYPHLAVTFGWSLQDLQKPGRNCRHSSDGTVTCRECGLTASEFIAAAFDYLNDNDGKVIDWEEE